MASMADLWMNLRALRILILKFYRFVQTGIMGFHLPRSNYLFFLQFPSPFLIGRAPALNPEEIYGC